MASLLDEFGRPIVTPHERLQREIATLQQLNRRTRASYDAARHSPDWMNYWANADASDPDKANSKEVRHTLIRRSRYETGSNGYYAGMLQTHANMLVGPGPNLRMITGNRRFNTFIETAFYRWASRIQLRRKLWCMAHARTQDGESFGVLVHNPEVANDVKLDLLLFEAEQVQTPFLPFAQRGYTDGIRYDEFNNILWYDVLPEHPGGAFTSSVTQTAVRVPRESMLHWLKLTRPGSHRGIPALTSTLNHGAAARRWREATIAKAEVQADFTVLMKSTLPAVDDEAALTTFDTSPIDKRLMTILPNGYEPTQLEADTPPANFEEFHRANTAEQSRPMSMPVNLAMCDSSTYSFASGKLDTIGYRAALDVERMDCNDLVLEPLFAAWFREWSLVTSNRNLRVSHQWDWPAHAVIDARAEAEAVDIQLRNGSKTLRQVYSDAGRDFEDELVVMTSDYFGEVTDETLQQMRQILLKSIYPAAVEPVEEAAPARRVQQLTKQIKSLERQVQELVDK